MSSIDRVGTPSFTARAAARVSVPPRLAVSLAVLALMAIGLITALPDRADAANDIVGSADDTGGVHLYNAGSDTQGFLTPPPANCAGIPQSDPTNETVNIAVQNGILRFIGDEASEIISFTLGADLERDGGNPDSSIEAVTTGLSAIDDYGFVGNALGASDDDANYDAQTGGDVHLRLDVAEDPAITDLAVIVPDGVAADGFLGNDAVNPFGNLGGNEIFIFEDAETSGMKIELFGPGGAGPVQIDIDDYQRNPDTAGAADDTLITIDLDTLDGFSFPYVESIRITDDGNPIVPNLSTCPDGTVLDTSLELDAVATRTDTVLAGPPSVDIQKSTNGEDADAVTGPTVLVGEIVNWEYVITNSGGAPLVNLAVADDQGVPVICESGANIIAGPLAPGESFTCAASGIAVEGQYGNIGTVVGTPITPAGDVMPHTNVSDADPSHYIGQSSSVQIEKSTNGADADTPTGPLVAVDAPVTWSYEVTNDGPTHLVNAEVTDSDPSVTVDCGDGTNVIAAVLAPNDSHTCSATGIAVFGQYSNDGTVSAAPADTTGTPITGATPVTDTDPSHYVGEANPAVVIEKDTNGNDADIAPGVSLVAGEAITWTYAVTNTGDVALIELTVTDDRLADAAISCGGGSNTVAGPIAPGASFTCAATGTATNGAYANLAIVSGTAANAAGNAIVGLASVTDDDPSHYFGSAPGIDIEKATNGQDADVAPGVSLLAGDAVTWTYVVTNTGGATLLNVTVTDDQGVAPDCLQGTGNLIATLAPAAVVTCSATGVAGLGGYANVGAVSGQPVDGQGQPVGAPVSDSDPSHYTASADPRVRIEKSTNGFDADAAPGPTISLTTPVTWEYRVTNIGDVSLVNVTVQDSDAAVVVDCGNGTNAVAGPIAPNSEFVCTATGASVLGQYMNDSTVSATPSDPSGVPLGLAAVSDDDPSHYFGGDPGIDIEKATNGVDADIAPGPAIPIGGAVTWSYVVTNNGNQILTDVTVTDDDPAVIIACPENTANVIADLDPGESVTCTANATAGLGAYANIGSVTGLDPVGGTQSDDDPSHYFGADPAIDVEKATNGEDADVQPGPSIEVGGTVTWTYIVTNTGTTTLVDVTVVDSEGVTIDCGGAIPTLAPTDSVTCTGGGSAIPGQYSNTATASGTPTDSTGTPLLGVNGQTLADVTDDDPSHYFGGQPGLLLEKATNTFDADTEPGPVVAVGATITWTYAVTNNGNETVTSLEVIDSDPSVTVDCGAGLNTIATLPPGGSAECTAAGIAASGQYENVGTVVGQDPRGMTLGDTDPSHYFAAEPAIEIEKATNGDDADAAPGPALETGATVKWSYEVTNTGNVDLIDVSVSDDDPSVTIDCSGSSVIATLASGASKTCTAEGTAIDGQYANIGSVSGDPIGPDGEPTAGGPVTDDDPSHYVGSITPIGSIGDTVWADANADGVFDVDEVGIAGVDVVLTDGSDSVIATATTDGDGTYLFAGLDAGSYAVSIETATLPPGYVQTYDASIPLDHQSETTIAASGVDLDQDFGYVPPPSITIEKATNGTDADTAPGVTVQAGSAVTWTYVVTNNGAANVTNLVVTDDEVDAVEIACNGGVTNTVDALAPGETASCSARGTAIQGAYANLGTVIGEGPLGTPVADDDPSHYTGVLEPLGSIGDLVWFDANGDGIKQASETGYSGVTIVLIDGTGTVVSTQVTDGDGLYLFSNVPAGQYTVTVDKSLGGIPSEAIRSFDSDGSLDNSSTVTLTAGEENLDQDFGYTLAPVGSIGDTIWWDDDADGVLGAGEVGIGNVTVALLAADGSPADSATTNADGRYLFSDVAAGDYTVVVDAATLPPGAGLVTDPQGAVDGRSDLTLAVGSSNLDQDFGYLRPAAVGDFVFADADDDGIQDAGETGVAGAVLTLFEAGSDGQPIGSAVMASETTDADGFYQFTGVDATKTYVVQLQAPVGSVLTQQNIGSDDAVDSDGSPFTGLSDPFTVEAGGENQTLDFGLVPVAPEVSIAKTTNGSDADVAPGPNLGIGTTVTWEYTVTNTGGVALASVAVSDDREGAIACPQAILDVDESMVCVKTGSVLSGQYDNLGSVTATPVDADGDPLGTGDVTDSDPSHYVGGTVINLNITPTPTPTTPTTVPASTATVVPPTPTPAVGPGIAVTGRDSGDTTSIAVLLVVGGAMLVVVARSRRRDLAP